MAPASVTNGGPRLSIVMAAYNEEKSIDDVVRTVLAQTYEDYEFIIVDDGSRDRTVELANEWVQRDDRIVLHVNDQNMGQTPSLNKGIGLARGDWIARIDADDLWEPEKLSEQMTYLDTHPEVGLIGTCGYAVNEQTGHRSFMRKPETDEAIKKAIWRYCPFTHSTVVIRRDLLEKHGVYDPHYRCSQDYDLWFRLAFNTRCYNVPKPLCTKITHRPQSLTFARWKEIERESLAIRYKNMRAHGGSAASYVSLLPSLAKLCLPAGAKRWKLTLARGVKTGR